MASDSSDWERLGNRFYRKLEQYSMDWVHKNRGKGVGLDTLIVAVGPFAGCVAVTRDPRIATEARGALNRPCIDVYSASGFQEQRIPWEGARIVHLGWSDQELLVVVTQNASVHLWDVRGPTPTFVREFSMGQLATDVGVREAKMCPEGRGLVVLTNNERFFSVANFDDPKVKRLAEVPSAPEQPGAPPAPEGGGRPSVTSWTILHNDRSIEVVVAAHADLYVLDQTEVWQPALAEAQLGQYSAMTVSPNGRLIALFGETGKIGVFSTDFTENITSFDTQSRVAPRQLEWCGSDSVVAYWDQLGAGTGTLLMVGPGSKFINYNYEKRIFLSPEVDGVRIISETTHEFLQAVPETVERIFQLGVGNSKYPGAVLFMARQAYDEKNPIADDLIRNMKDDLDIPDMLGQGIQQCIEAAGHEATKQDSSTQKSLLKAARFGMYFVDKDSAPFTDMVQRLRILYHVRDYHIGIPLTMRQLNQLSIKVLIDRLIARNIFWLAFLICEYLKLTDAHTTNRVLVHWASSMTANMDASDDTIARTIIDKIGNQPGISYAEIAREATLQGKPDLAIRLLDKEPKYSEQVPLLLTMGEDSLALDKAVESGDTALAHFVIMHLQGKIAGKGDFLRFIHTKPGARDLFLQYCRESDKELLKDYYYQHDILKESAHIKLREAYAATTVDDAIATLKSAAREYADARDQVFTSRATEDQARLFQCQKGLEQSLKKSFVDLPLGDTIYEVILSGDQDRAKRLKSDFKVPDKRFWWIKVKALSEAANWSELERFAKSKKSPIGYEPFAKECITKNNRFEAKKYVMRMPTDQRVPLLMQIGAWDEAVDTAAQLRDDGLLDEIGAACQGRRDVLKRIADKRAK